MRHRACHWCAGSVGPVNVGANFALSAIKGFLGVVGGSQALVADAIHSVADLISSGLLAVGLQIVKRPPNQRHPYGYGKVEFLVAGAIYILLLGAGGLIFYDSVHMIVDKEEVSPSAVTLFGAALSAAVNELMYRQSLCVGGQLGSPSILANAAEKRADVYSSLAVLVGIAGAKMGVHVLDPLAAVLVAILILHSSLRGLWEATQGLIDSSPAEELVRRWRAAVLAVHGVSEVAHLRSREVGQKVWVEVEVVAPADQTIADGDSLRQEVIAALKSCSERPGEYVVSIRGPAEAWEG